VPAIGIQDAADTARQCGHAQRVGRAQRPGRLFIREPCSTVRLESSVQVSRTQGVGALVDHLLFKLGALEVDVFNLLALQDQPLLVFQRNRALADAFHLEFGLNLHDLEVGTSPLWGGAFA
jgi:hypothetical protein